VVSSVPSCSSVSWNLSLNPRHYVPRRSTCEEQSLHFSSAVSVSKSTTFSGGLSGISSAGARAYSDGNNAETESHSVSFGQTTASAHGAVENGRAITNAASSIGTSRSSAASGADRFLSRGGIAPASAGYPNRPRWSNVGPNNGQSEYSLRSRVRLVADRIDRVCLRAIDLQLL